MQFAFWTVSAVVRPTWPMATPVAGANRTPRPTLEEGFPCCTRAPPQVEKVQHSIGPLTARGCRYNIIYTPPVFLEFRDIFRFYLLVFLVNYLAGASSRYPEMPGASQLTEDGLAVRWIVPGGA